MERPLRLWVIFSYLCSPPPRLTARGQRALCSQNSSNSNRITTARVLGCTTTRQPSSSSRGVYLATLHRVAFLPSPLLISPTEVPSQLPRRSRAHRATHLTWCTGQSIFVATQPGAPPTLLFISACHELTFSIRCCRIGSQWLIVAETLPNAHPRTRLLISTVPSKIQHHPQSVRIRHLRLRLQVMAARIPRTTLVQCW